MFFSIPSSVGKTVTPLGVKSVTHMFFQPKNSRLFRYDVNKSGAFVTVSIDGKTVASHLFVPPFCTQTVDPACTFGWRDVAIEVNMNVDSAEVEVKCEDEFGLSYDTDDYTVVLVCSGEAVDESKGYDFFETKRLTLQASVDINVNDLVADTYGRTLRRARAAYAQELNDAEEGAAYSETSDKVLEKYPDNTPLSLVISYNGVTLDTGDQQVSYGSWQWDVPEDDYENYYTGWGNNDYNVVNAFTSQAALQSVKYWSPYKNEIVAKEFILTTDYEPTTIFTYQACLPYSGSYLLRRYDYPLSISISGTEREVFPDNLDMGLISATVRTPMRKALWRIPEDAKVGKNISFRIRPKGESFAWHNSEVVYWYLFIILGYKKLA